ncbi:calcipressin-2-like [Sycon ciliatum]|uniref:calcipressin-2-like n=1 Tax=Sycon ciliatum TaxID=27933 RepID=UPI0020A86757|eukprot:scpid71563/ scgid27292/ Calcipressin-2; Down syndrome candidate region 1-like 1; Regulator of calcineurin 2
MQLKMANRGDSPSDNSDEEQSSFKLIVRNLSDSIFTDDDVRESLERLFLSFSVHATFHYMKTFRRLRVAYLNESQAEAARSALHGTMFEEQKLSVFRARESLTELFSRGRFLKPPKPERMELISPPPSPPVGWVQSVEAPPVVDFQLQAAVAGLAESGSVVELYSGEGSLPTIQVTSCD